MADSVPEARAYRLKRMRECTGLSRIEFQTKYNISSNTIKGWETVCHGGLTEKGAKLFIEALKYEGILCSPQWLLHGEGPEPFVSANAFSNNLIEKNINEASLIQSEISSLKQYYQDTFIYHVVNEEMTPFFYPGDIVAGILVSENTSIHILESLYILVDVNGNSTLRLARLNESSKLLDSRCISGPFANIITQHACEDISAYRVIWHRCKANDSSI